MLQKNMSEQSERASMTEIRDQLPIYEDNIEPTCGEYTKWTSSNNFQGDWRPHISLNP